MDTQQRINRIIGQLKGVQRMTEGERDCAEILQQISAIKKAIDGLSKDIVVSNVCKYVPKAESKKVERMVERAISL